MALTPMMQQYIETKKAYKDSLLFYRLGDFYEMFFEDALVVSKELELTLTGKSCGLEEKAPMCGVPHHCAQTYINRLVQKGYKVAVCEQVEDPKLAKGIVKREVVRIVTPGTNQDLGTESADSNNFLACIISDGRFYALTFVDVTTGKVLLTTMEDYKILYDELVKHKPVEIIYNDKLGLDKFDIKKYCKQEEISFTELDTSYFDIDEAKERIKNQFNISAVDGLGISKDAEIIVLGGMLKYLYEVQKSALKNIIELNIYNIGRDMIIDSFTRRNLEITETMRDAKKKGSLFWVLDKTKTAMGARFMRDVIVAPSIDYKEINARYDAIDEINSAIITRDELREYLSGIYDIERLISKIAYQSANPRDLLALSTSIKYIKPLYDILKEYSCTYIEDIKSNIDCMEDIKQLIDESISENAPMTIRDGGIIKEGYNESIDELREASIKGKDWLFAIEEEERKKTGIKNLRIKYSKNFGYCIEVSKSFIGEVPDYYVRRQTLTNAERYTIEKVKEIESKILGAEEKLYKLELDLFQDIRKKISDEISRILKTAKSIAELDFIQSLAYVAYENNYKRPEIVKDGSLSIIGGRHPVVEKMINDSFIANDVKLDLKNERVAIITGPNMSGKSTYMRQVALIVLMAQIGSFVPADKCKMDIVDRVFTRVGASDDLASGQSTFMVEMTEVANILRNASSRSLLILDEIGRGTSTFDGLSLAWAIVEYIANPKIIGAKTLFATHYHELAELEGKVDNVINYFIDVHENNDNVVFLRKILRGGANKSYGIQVAKLAGVPEAVIKRAKELANELDQADVTKKITKITKNSIKFDEEVNKQTTIFEFISKSKEEEIIKDLKEMDIDNFTPKQALDLLYELKEKVKDE